MERGDDGALPSVDELPRDHAETARRIFAEEVKRVLDAQPGRTGMLLLLDGLAFAAALLIEGPEDERVGPWFEEAVRRERRRVHEMTAAGLA